MFILLFNPHTSSLELKSGFDPIIPLKLLLSISSISSTLLNTIINTHFSIYLIVAFGAVDHSVHLKTFCSFGLTILYCFGFPLAAASQKPFLGFPSPP